jgi:hypothetical protein
MIKAKLEGTVLRHGVLQSIMKTAEVDNVLRQEYL